MSDRDSHLMQPTPEVHEYARVTAVMLQAIFNYVRRIIQSLFTRRTIKKKPVQCIFCDIAGLDKILYQDDQIIAFEDIYPSGRIHWLISPIQHIRDIESLTEEHLPLLEEMQRIKDYLLREHCPDVPESLIHSGYHRGRRPILGTGWFWPDIISVHHLHLHVMIEPRWDKKWLKYPPWLLWMWKSDAALMTEMRGKKKLM